jgi:hypothetical protein
LTVSFFLIFAALIYIIASSPEVSAEPEEVHCIFRGTQHGCTPLLVHPNAIATLRSASGCLLIFWRNMVEQQNVSTVICAFTKRRTRFCTRD